MDVGGDTLHPSHPTTQWVPTAAERRRTRTKSACLGKLCNSLKMCGLSKDAKPWLSYVSLITVALLSNPKKMLKINEIYAFIEQTFPYYRYSRVNWRNSVRHNLSLNDCFVKVTVGPENGKRRGHYWTLHPDSFTMFDQGSLMRRHRRFVKPSKDIKDTSKANAENALVMPILQKISEELTRWRQQTFALEGDACKPSFVDYAQNLIAGNAPVGYPRGDQAAQHAPFTHYEHGLQGTQFQTVSPPFACSCNFCSRGNGESGNYGYYATSPELSHVHMGLTTPYTAFFSTVSPSSAQCIAMTNQVTVHSDCTYASNGYRPMTEITMYTGQHSCSPMSGDFVASANKLNYYE